MAPHPERVTAYVGRRPSAENLQPGASGTGIGGRWVFRTAVYGSVCTVVWEGRGCETLPIPIVGNSALGGNSQSPAGDQGSNLLALPVRMAPNGPCGVSMAMPARQVYSSWLAIFRKLKIRPPFTSLTTGVSARRPPLASYTPKPALQQSPNGVLHVSGAGLQSGTGVDLGDYDRGSDLIGV